MARRALREPTSGVEGVGLFSGRPSRVRVLPGAPGGGVWFERADLPGRPRVKAAVANVARDAAGAGLPGAIGVRNTTLVRAGGPFAMTIEHLMSALAGLGVWDALVELHGPEVPILDGSAAGFDGVLRRVLADAGEIAPAVLAAPVEVRDGNASIVAAPCEGPGSLEYRLDYGPGAAIPAQRASWHGGAEAYTGGVAPARTFSRLREARAMQGAGLFAHLTASDMLVIGDDGLAVENEFRYPDEPARHKLLDLIGDLALLGTPLRASVVATRSGHGHTHELVRRLVRALGAEKGPGESPRA